MDSKFSYEGDSCMTIIGLAEMIVPPVCALNGIYLFRVFRWRKRIADRAEKLMNEGSDGEPDWIIARKSYGIRMTEIAAGHTGVMPCMRIIIVWRWTDGTPRFFLRFPDKAIVDAPLHRWQYFADEALTKIKENVAEFHASRHAF
jgi:hypothetical protein